MMYFFFFQAEDGIRDLVRSRGLGDVYKRQAQDIALSRRKQGFESPMGHIIPLTFIGQGTFFFPLSLIHI